MNTPEQITIPFASEGKKRDIPQTGNVTDVLASFQYGFPPRTMSNESDAVPPSGQDLNAILYLLNTIAQYAQAGGVYPYSVAFAEAIGGYPVGAMVRKASGEGRWQNTVDGNTSDPDNGGSGWIPDGAAVMIGASDTANGAGGTVPAPVAGDQSRFLRGDGTWATIPPSMPIGAIYVQFAGQTDPTTLFGGTWENVSATYAGQFFRCEGGAAAAFGQSQSDGAPNITGSVSTGHSLALFSSFSGCFTTDGIYGGSQAGDSGSYSKGFAFYASNSNGKYSLNEVRPANSTIRVWKRTA
jgi:hypothetical protein